MQCSGEGIAEDITWEGRNSEVACLCENTHQFSVGWPWLGQDAQGGVTLIDSDVKLFNYV